MAPLPLRTIAPVVLLPLVSGIPPTGAQRDQDPRPIDYARQIQPLLQTYCYRCHGEHKQKADVRIDTLDPAMSTRTDAERWHLALDMIRDGEMPPEDEAQPSDDERRLLVRWLDESLAAAATRQQAERRVVLRRLTREQYSHSLQDLLGVDIDFTRRLPQDGRTKHGFANNGEVLRASPLHVETYEQLARQGLAQAIVTERPKTTRYRVTFGRGKGEGQVAGHTGGYQAVPLPTDDFRVEVLGDDRPTDERALRALQKRISVGLRGSSQDRFRTVDEGMMLLSALPHREVVPQSWQGPSPNLKLELQHCWPRQGDFVLRVRASRGYVPALREDLLVKLDEPAAVASWRDGDLVAPDGAIVLRAEQSDQRQNLRGDGDALLAVDVPKASRARLRFELPREGFYQIDLVHPPAKPDAMPSVRLKVSGQNVDERLQLDDEALRRTRVVTPLGAIGMREGRHHLELGGPFFVGFSHVVITAMADDHPLVQRLRQRRQQQDDAVRELTPALRALIGTRTDDGMDYTTFGEPVDVRAPLGEAETFEFFGRLENLPIPEPESGDTEVLSGFLLLGVWNDHLVKSAKQTGPPLLVEAIEFEAPWFATWPPRSHTDIFFARDGRDDDAYARAVIERFAQRAFRRPLQPGEVDRYAAFCADLRGGGERLEDAVAEVLVAVLCSPDFLFLCEPEDQLRDDGALPDWMLQNRLSYFLWDGPPDDELRALAAEGRLRGELLAQVDRMLDDPRAQRFLRRFTEQWLRLDRHDGMAIHVGEHRDYTRFVKRDMRDETHAFVRMCFAEDLPLTTFVQADFAMLNQNLAEFYGLPDAARRVPGARLRAVALPDDMPERRGGLLSHGSFHVGHSDGTEPHPIKRAVWLKGQLLGDHPPPPPPNVPDLDPSTPGFAEMTLKQRIEAHRDNDSCRDCHAGIDPYGFVFERMSAVGRLQPERKGRAVDATSTLPDGTPVDGLVGMQRYLVEHRRDQLARAFATHLFAYALGRDVHFADDDELDRIVEHVRIAGYRTRSVVRAIVSSPSFLSK